MKFISWSYYTFPYIYLYIIRMSPPVLFMLLHFAMKRLDGSIWFADGLRSPPFHCLCVSETCELQWSAELIAVGVPHCLTHFPLLISTWLFLCTSISAFSVSQFVSHVCVSIVSLAAEGLGPDALWFGVYLAAQKKYVYIYDNQGIEIHCLRDLMVCPSKHTQWTAI